MPRTKRKPLRRPQPRRGGNHKRLRLVLAALLTFFLSCDTTIHLGCGSKLSEYLEFQVDSEADRVGRRP